VLVSDTEQGPGVSVVGPGSLSLPVGHALSTSTGGILAAEAAARLKPAWNAAQGAVAGAVRLDVGGLPPGALVLVDDESEAGWRYAPLSRWVAPGTHLLRARIAGEPERVSRIALLAGSGPTQLSLPKAVRLPPEDPEALAHAVRAAVLSHEAEFTYCYEHALKRNPAVEGRLLLTLRVNAEGRVAQASAKANDGEALSGDLPECLVRTVRAWKLPAGTAATLELPVELTRAPIP